MSEIDKNEQAELDAAVEAEAAEAVAKVEKAKAPKDKADDKKSNKKPGFFKRIAKWFKEMKSELKKVQWPTMKQTMKSTGVVILCVIIVGIFIMAFDALAGAVVNNLIKLFA